MIHSTSFELINPRSGLHLKKCFYTSVEDIEINIQSQHHFFSTWKKKSIQERQLELKRIVPFLKIKRDLIAESITNEMGKSLVQSLAEVDKCIDATLQICDTDYSIFNSEKIINKTYSESFVYHEPLGVILSILPFNYPAWQAFRVFLPTLLSGNVCLIKSSEIAPTAGDLIAECFKNAGLEGLLQHSIFSHRDTESIISHPYVGGISLTGSIQAGALVSSLAARYFKKCVLELGGNDPALILKDADFEKAVSFISKSRLQNAGQVCISTKRVFIPRVNKDMILDLLKNQFNQILHSKIELVGPLATAEFAKKYNQIIEEFLDCKNISNEKVYEFNLEIKNSNDLMAYVNPQIFYFDELKPQLNNLEIFGPCLIVIGYDEVKDVIDYINSSELGLGATIYGKDEDSCLFWAKEIQAGQVAINEMVRSDVHLPFGGCKKSGMGRESGLQGLFQFTETKVISMNKKR